MAGQGEKVTRKAVIVADLSDCSGLWRSMKFCSRRNVCTWKVTNHTPLWFHPSLALCRTLGRNLRLLHRSLGSGRGHYDFPAMVVGPGGNSGHQYRLAAARCAHTAARASVASLAAERAGIFR